MKELPTRKNIRLDSFDYRANALYFVTFCTKDKNPVLWEYAEIINIGYFDKTTTLTDYEYKNNLVGATVSQKQSRFSDQRLPSRPQDYVINYRPYGRSKI